MVRTKNIWDCVAAHAMTNPSLDFTRSPEATGSFGSVGIPSDWLEREVIYIASRQVSTLRVQVMMNGRFKFRQRPTPAVMEETADVADRFEEMKNRSYIAIRPMSRFTLDKNRWPMSLKRLAPTG